MFEVVYTKPAEEDLFSIIEYISQVLKSPKVANNFLNEIEKKTELLAENPFIFSLVKDEFLSQHKIRYTLVKNYFVFYTIEEKAKTVSIIRIMYARRDWINLLKRDI